MAAPLGDMTPKAMVAGLILSAFLVIIAVWWNSNNNIDKQAFVQESVQQTHEKHVAPLESVELEMKPAEKEAMRQMLASVPEVESIDFERMVWVKDIIHTISPWVSDQDEAQSIAYWVYVNSMNFKLSPELVLAVIGVESAFDHFAISRVGALGLMQVMPFWKKEIGKTSDNLLNIKTNVRYGCLILRYYINRYKTLDRALAAYNGSLGRMKYPRLVYAKMKRFKAVGDI